MSRMYANTFDGASLFDQQTFNRQTQGLERVIDVSTEHCLGQMSVSQMFVGQLSINPK